MTTGILTRRAEALSARTVAMTIAAVTLLLWAAWLHLVGFLTAQALGYNDFARFYASALSWRHGGSLYATTAATGTMFRGQWIDFPNLNPPHFELLILPLTWLSLRSAYYVWFALNLAGFVAAISVVVTTLRLRLTGPPLLLLCGFMLASTPVTGWTSSVQVTGLVAFVGATLWREVHLERMTRAAVWIGVAWSIKLLFAPLVVWLLCRRELRAASVAVATGLALFMVGVLVFGGGEHVAWVKALGSIHWTWFSVNGSITGIFARAAYISGGASVRPPDLPLMTWVGLAASVPVALIGLVAASRELNPSRGLLLILVTCLLTFPAAWIEYWVVLWAPLAATIGDRRVQWAFALSLPAWLVQASRIYPYPSMLWAVTVGSLYCWCLFAAWMVLVAAWRSRESDARQAISPSVHLGGRSFGS